MASNMAIAGLVADDPSKRIYVHDEVEVVGTNFSQDVYDQTQPLHSNLTGGSGSRTGIGTGAGTVAGTESEPYTRHPYRSSRIKDGFNLYNMPSTYAFRSLQTLRTVSSLNSNKVAENLADFAESDPDSGKTFGRRLVENFLMKMRWYNPNLNKDYDDDGNDNGESNTRRPDLREGWAFYEHITLARHFELNEDGKRVRKAENIERAEPGERREKTELYSFWKTPGESLNDWGVGVALYFNSVWAMSMLLLLAGLLNIPNRFFFQSEKYSGVKNHQKDFSPFLKGSAICNQTSWRGCEEGYCDIDQLKLWSVKHHVDDSTNMTYVQASNCDGARLSNGILHFATIFFIFFATVLFNWYQSNKQVILDEDKVTTSDYSVRIMNPPKDAVDPDEWQTFFEKYDDKGVNIVTVLLNNSLLLRAHLKRRHLVKELHKWLPNVNLGLMENDENDEVIQKAVEDKVRDYKQPCIEKILYVLLRPFVKCLSMFLYPDELYERIKANKDLVQELQTKEYDATDVFVTFETEAGQRLALAELTTGNLSVRTQRSNKIEANLFRGNYVLDIKEPPEPRGVRYLDLDTSMTKCIIQQTITFLITMGLVIAGGMLVHRTRKNHGPLFAGFVTTALNLVIPLIVKLLMLIEKHANEGDRQLSMYVKILVFRWVNTAITVKIIVSLTNILSPEKRELLTAIDAIFVSEMLTVPVLSILDIMGNLSKHYFAPRATTTLQMNLCFKGTPYNLAEKYTDISKIILLAYCYSALNPNFLFMGSLALFIRYFSDKFCVMRIWSSAPYVGAGLADFSRKYFFTLAIVVGATFSAYDWALFRFDRICVGKADSVSPVEFTADGTLVTVTSTDAVRVCTESTCCQQIGPTFPVVPRKIETSEFKWMSDEQRELTVICGWTSFALIIAYFVLAFGSSTVHLLLSQFSNSYKPTGKDQKIDFSNVKGIEAYIPQILIGSYAFPLLACNIDDVDQKYIGWNDPGTSYDEYNMLFDIEYSGLKRSEKIAGSTRHYDKIHNHKNFRDSDNADKTSKPIYSIVKQYTVNHN